MSMGEMRGAKFGKIKRVIYGRTVMILAGFLAQLVALAVGYVLLRNYNGLFYALFLAASACAIIYIYNAAGNPDVKLAWMFPIALFPVFGAVFYWTIIMEPGTQALYGRLQRLSENTKKYVPPRPESQKRLRAQSVGQAELF